MFETVQSECLVENLGRFGESLVIRQFHPSNFKCLSQFRSKQCSIWQIMEIYQPPPQLAEHYKTKYIVIQVYRTSL